MTRLTPDQQLERFGMSLEDAHALRDRVEKNLSARQLEEARKAWQDLSYELRGNKGGPFQCDAHPEAVRFEMLKALDEGNELPRAVQIAREFAHRKEA